MYLHIGDGRVVVLQEVVAFICARTVHQGGEAAAFLEYARAHGTLVPALTEPPKSYVITTRAVYASPLSTATLVRRATNPRLLLEGE